MAYADNQFNSYRGDILKELIDNFGKTLNIGIIKDVVQQNNFDVHKSTMALLELSAFNDNQIHSRVMDIRPLRNRIQYPDNYISTIAIEETIDNILKGFKVLVLLRGVPGSGKSYLAKNILNVSMKNPNHAEHIFSADDFFMKNGIYMYDVTKIDQAHSSVQINVYKQMNRGNSPLIVDNTNTQIWEMIPYTRMAVQFGYKIFVVESNTRWSSDCVELTKRNKHGVPKSTIRKMLDRYVKNINAEALLSNCNLTMQYQNNPQLRSYPPLLLTTESLPAANLSLKTSTVHNNNSKNQDLKLPSSQISSKGINKSNNSLVEVSNLIEISDEVDNNKPKLKNNIISDNNYLSSNYDFTPLNLNENVLGNWTTINDNVKEQLQTCDRGINCNGIDLYKNSDDAYVIVGRLRDINPLDKKMSLNKSGYLDKGCSTEGNIFPDKNEDLANLIQMFPKIPPLFIRDMYDTCKGNFEQTFEIFLEDNKDYSNISYPKIDQIEKEAAEPKKQKLNNQEQISEYYPEQISACTNNEKKKLPEVFQNNPILMKNSNGKKMLPDQNACHSKTSYLDLPSTSKSTPNERKLNDDFIMLDCDSDSEFENCSSPTGSDTNIIFEDTVELNLGHSLIEQLEMKFGDPGYNYPKGFQPVVQVPKMFARQLYAFYVESVYQQMDAQKAIFDKMAEEDEAFARKLFEEENGLTKEPQPGGLREIMNEQMAMSLVEKETSQWKNCTPTDLATELTKKKLIEAFPMVDKNALLEIYHANNRNYKETVDDLLASMGTPNERHQVNLKVPPLSEKVFTELQTAHDNCALQENEGDNDGKTSDDYRDEANEYLKKRNQLYQKAQEYYSQGQREVAQFYSQLAQKQTQFYDIANNKAATILLEDHSQRLQNFDTLDLHYLYVKEAIPALDVFIDRNINLLNGGDKISQNLLVITGRGNRSKNGVSKIKPAVMSRLKKRDIKFVQLNPGLLKIKVNRNSVITSNL